MMFELIRSIGAECISDEELLHLVESGDQIIMYDGFEPSRRMHVAQGILKVMNVNKATSAGAKFYILDC